MQKNPANVILFNFSTYKARTVVLWVFCFGFFLWFFFSLNLFMCIWTANSLGEKEFYHEYDGFPTTPEQFHNKNTPLTMLTLKCLIEELLNLSHSFQTETATQDWGKLPLRGLRETIKIRYLGVWNLQCKFIFYSAVLQTSHIWLVVSANRNVSWETKDKQS